MMDELLSLIKENPRLTNAELAAALDRDEAQVAQQVRQYEADGVIKGYCAILDKEKAGDESSVTALTILPGALRRWKKWRAFS